ncbi:hypothetical protein C0W27_20850 [Photobacterium angustum]|uniref:Peptidase n=2 Tax=Photobacterium angustum TaxID=661 RepID=A0ABX5GZ76_PHOAN|nr:hypothetical protein C0W27_20850 [Photobacterium angustum]
MNKLEQDAWDIYVQAKLRSEFTYTTFAKAFLKHNSYGNKPYIAMIDYGLPSNTPRFWIVDLLKKKLVLKTFVSHGIHSGNLYAKNFSNDINSKQTSLGTFRAAEVYRGRFGRSLRLDGLDPENSNARRRAIVIHGASYSNPNVIKELGMLGQSWGCPSLPLNTVNAVIQKLQNGGIIYAYR